MTISALKREAPSAREVPPCAVLVLRAAEQDVLVLLGEADMATSELLVEQVVRALPAPPRPVVVELSALTFCDLSGLDALHELAGAAADAEVPLTFRGASPELQWLHRTAVALEHASRRWTVELPGLDVVSVTGASC